VARGKVSFDSQNDKYASHLSCDASPEVYLAHLIYQMTNALHSYPELQISLGPQKYCKKNLLLCQGLSVQILQNILKG
jgi:hypothetical protein